MIINALAYQQNLDGYSGIKGLCSDPAKTTGKHLTKDAVIAGFDEILDINFWPIFHVAKELLLQIPANTARNILEQMASAADGIADAIQHNDIAGTVFQKLIADRKNTQDLLHHAGSHHPDSPPSHSEDLNWADPETLKGYKIADYACGSGGINACQLPARPGPAPATRRKPRTNSIRT